MACAGARCLPMGCSAALVVVASATIGDGAVNHSPVYRCCGGVRLWIGYCDLDYHPILGVNRGAGMSHSTSCASPPRIRALTHTVDS